MTCSSLPDGALLGTIHAVLTLPRIFILQELQGSVQQQRADIESARDALTALCRSHPSQELADLSSELTSIAKRTEAVAQCCVKTKSDLQDGLQRHFNGKKRECLLYFLMSCHLKRQMVSYLRLIHVQRNPRSEAVLPSLLTL